MIVKFFKDNLLWILGVFAVIIALIWLYNWWTADAKLEARLNKEQAEAAIDSGADAVNTVGEAGRREADSEALTRASDREIRNAEGSEVDVGVPAHDAGLRSLCKRRAYRSDPRCVQYLNSR